MSESIGDARTKAARIVRQRLESLQRAGISHLPKAKRNFGPVVGEMQKPPAAAVAEPNAEPQQMAAVSVQTRLDDSAPLQGVLPPADRPAALELIRAEVKSCTRCAELCSGRTQTVFGVGSPTARICFIGEAPGADEDRLGEPFVGRAGQLLTKMIQACGLKREEVYILNVLKCRPPGNRTPLLDEVANCRGFMERQLEIIRPEIICCLGAVAAQAVLATDRSIGKLRGKFHEYLGIQVICTYHPAYLLRNPAAKVDAWEDLKMMMRKLGVELR